MQCLLTIERKESYLHAKVSGPNTPPAILEYLTQVRAACVEQRCCLVLIEENLDGPRLSITTLFRVVTQAVGNVGTHIQRLAFVDISPAHDAANMKFAETVAINRGVNMRLFPTLAEAEAWLQTPEQNELPFPAITP